MDCYCYGVIESIGMCQLVDIGQGDNWFIWLFELYLCLGVGFFEVDQFCCCDFVCREMFVGQQMENVQILDNFWCIDQVIVLVGCLVIVQIKFFGVEWIVIEEGDFVWVIVVGEVDY